MPCGERIGSFEARFHAPQGRSTVGAREAKRGEQKYQWQDCFWFLGMQMVNSAQLKLPENLYFAGLGFLRGSNCIERTMPSLSFTTINWFGLMSFSVSTRPLGQRIASRSIFWALPMPKWTRKSLCEK